MDDLSPAQTLLAAAQFATTSELPRLEALIVRHRDLFTTQLIYRLLYTFLPVETVSDYGSDLVKLLGDVDGDFKEYSALDHDVLPNIEPSKDAEHILKEFVLDEVPIRMLFQDDSLTSFVIAFLQKVEALDGINLSICQLFSQFSADHPNLGAWMNAYLLPLSKLQNEFYPGQASYLTTSDLESSSGVSGVSQLLCFAENVGPSAEIGRDIREVVSPWVQGSNHQKRRKLDSDLDAVRTDTSFHDVNVWILHTAPKDFALASKAVTHWDGPVADGSVDDISQSSRIQFIQTALALTYSDHDSSGNDLDLKKTLVSRAAEMAELLPPDFSIEMPNISELSALSQASRADFLRNALLRAHNPVTTPSTDSIELLYAVLASQNILAKYQLESTALSVAQCALFASTDQQLQELRRLLKQAPRLTRVDLNWVHCRQDLLWLAFWQDPVHVPSESKIAYLGRIPSQTLESEILKAMLNASQFDAIQDIYLRSDDHPPLPQEVVRESVLKAIYEAYDNASNGNRTRGGIKRATDILKAFQTSLANTTDFEHIEHLIKATHSLSFYQLTLQRGVPFQPVSIRVSKDPLSLLEKVLEQNNKAYASLDDLLGIARNLVLAELPNDTKHGYIPGEDLPLEQRLFDAEHRVSYLAINAALADHDFDTAYSLIVTRFNTAPVPDSAYEDDISWRAAYAAGKYRPASTPANIHDRISSLSKRIELLSQALRLAPAQQLPEILATWRRCEEEMDSLRSQALKDERSFVTESSGQIPGGFEQDDRALDSAESRKWAERRAFNATSGPSYEEEAPVGLFDMARGAASSIRKSAFPLRVSNAQNLQVKVRNNSDAHRQSGDWDVPGSPDSDGQHRLRKRDMISNAVTGTLVSGMGWVLGAKPAEGRDQGQ